jgi:hypothetical protein
MTDTPRSLEQVLADQFRLTSDLAQLTGQYHGLLQKIAAADFALQLAEMQADAAAIAEAERSEIAMRLAADACESRISDLERQMSALAAELAALPRSPS